MPTEPEVPPMPTPQTLLTAPPKMQLHADSTMPQYIQQLLDSRETHLADKIPHHHTQPNSQRLADDVTTSHP